LYDYRWHVAMLAVIFFADFFVAMEHLSESILLSNLFVPYLMIPLATFMLFYCDTPGRLRDLFVSAGRAIKMLWYGLPFYFILMVAAGVWYVSLSFVLWQLFFPLAYVVRTVPVNGFYGYFYSLFVSLVIILISVIPLAFAATFYTKKLHDYSEKFLG
jgi:hypothetical protein